MHACNIYQSLTFSYSVKKVHITGIKKKLPSDVDLKQGYNHAKFTRSCFNVVREKANVKVFLFCFVFFKWENMSIISLEYVRSTKKRCYIYNLADALNNRHIL